MSDLQQQIDVAVRRFKRDMANTINQRKSEIERLAALVNEPLSHNRLRQAITKLQEEYRRLADRKGRPA